MSEEQARLKISAVARLTGVSVHTIRKWETRYGALTPQRSPGGERLFTHGDVERVRLIKRLTATGLALPDVAAMSTAELTRSWEQLAHTEQTAGRGDRQAARVAVLGGDVDLLLADLVESSSLLELVASGGNLAELEASLAGAAIDVLVYQCSSVRPETERAVRGAVDRLAACAAVVIYRLGAKTDLLSLRAHDLATLRAPADQDALEMAVLGVLSSADRVSGRDNRLEQLVGYEAAVQPPRLSPQAIARVARAAPRLHCECPSHLAELVLSLRAFEDYSAECESRSPQDAPLHRYLWERAARARAEIEQAIERIAAAEGIDLAD